MALRSQIRFRETATVAGLLDNLALAAAGREKAIVPGANEILPPIQKHHCETEGVGKVTRAAHHRAECAEERNRRSGVA